MATKRVPYGLRKRFPRKEQIIATRLAHPTWSSRRMAQEIGCSSGLVRATLRRCSLPLAVNKFSPQLQSWERQAIADGYRAGEKVQALAAEFNTTACTVCAIARRAGVPRRQIGGFRV